MSTSDLPGRYVARPDDPDDPEEVTIYDEAADGIERSTTWVSSDWWISREEVR
jgi:hypothetical protein